MKEKNRGITLIALVITIVVMMILVGASIKLVIDSNMIDTADNAVKKYRLAENNEKNFLDNVSINGGKLEDYLPLQQINAGERATLKSLYGSVVVPAGFTVSMIPSEQNVEDGLVIYDIPEGENVNWENVYQVGGLLVNDDLKEVSVEGEPVKLTPIEYNILLLLVKNPGKVFSIEQIYESIWNEEAIGADNTVAVHIRHIREKIEINPKEPRYLKVVWGIGYKIEKQ